ncbi:MAG: phosphoribosylanthranilate isomerase [Candidatus Glassbacteria bacterium]|nr:phosphoribosylanthranilate isomerase [Candidatus Glassbacteria bacterium]
MSVRIKICGITRLDDALAASELGADALGFVFHKPSPRYLEPEKAAGIIRKIPRLVTTVGVFVDLPADEVRRVAATAGLDRAQLSGDETPEYCRRLGLSWIKAFRLAAEGDLKKITEYETGGDILLDSYVKGVPGGTGEKFNWEWAAMARSHGRVILAGGLEPSNVAEAIRTAAPYAVDVSSGVESAPGIKDHRKLEDFFAAVRNTG